MIQRSEIEEVIKRCKANDRAAQQLVYKSYYDRYYTLCMRYMADHDLACDVLNQMFYKVFTNIRQLRDPGLFEGWMKQVCINTCLNELKKRKNNLYQEISETPMHALPRSENEAMSNLGMEELLGMVKRLPLRMRMVFNMYVVDGYSHKEISQQLSISEGTSKFHLNQARIQLKRMIQDLSNVKIRGTSHG